MDNERILELWERIRDELRRLRGLNRFRGNEVHILPKRIIRIPEENRQGNLQRGEFVIHLTDAESELWAEHWPGGEKLYLKDFEYGLTEFLGRIVDQCRGDHYLHTNSKTAKYRKAPSSAEAGGENKK